MNNEKKVESEFRSISNLLIGILWYSKLTILFVLIVILLYFFTSDKSVFMLLTGFGLLIMFLGFVPETKFEESRLGYLGHPGVVRHKNWTNYIPETNKYLSDSLFMSVKGIFVFILGLFFLFFLK